MIQRLKEILKYDDGGFTVGKVQGIINRYGGGKSPLTADNYIEVSKNTGVPIDLLLAQGIVESNLGTKGMAVRTQNVGNVGNNGNTGKTTGQGNWLNGLYRMANLLKNEYKVQNQSDVQRMLDTNFLRPGKGGRYAEESNYASQVGKVLNTIRGGKFYGEPKSPTQVQQTTETQNGQTISISLPNYGTQQILPDNPIGFDFGTLPKQFQNEIIENHRLQQEKANQEAEKSAIDKQNEVVQQELQRRQQERDQLLSTLPVLEHASLSPTRNNYTDLLKSATQQFQSGGLTKSQDEAMRRIVNREAKENFEIAREFEKEYVEGGNKIKERIAKMNYYDPEGMVKKLNKKLDNVRLIHDNSSKNANGAYYSSKANEIAYDDSRFYSGSTDVMNHEMGHLFHDINEPSTGFINDRNGRRRQNTLGRLYQSLELLNPSYRHGKGHELLASEVIADVHAARKDLYGISGFDQRFSNMTDEAYEDLKEAAKLRPDSGAYRLMNKIGAPETMFYRDIMNKKPAERQQYEKDYIKKYEKDKSKYDEIQKRYIIDIMNRIVKNDTDQPNNIA